MLIRLTGFLGENRALHPMLLPETVGVTSTNQKPGRGDLRPWNAPLTVATHASYVGRQTIYRMGRDVAPASRDTNYWLSWPTEVHVVCAPNAADTAERTYYSGGAAFAPKWTNTAFGLTGIPSAVVFRELGVPAPVSRCTVTATPHTEVAAGSFVVGTLYTIVSVGTPTATDFTLIGSLNSTVGTRFTATGVGVGDGTAVPTGLTETRYYTYTYVTDIGEESAPAAPTGKTLQTTDSIALSGFSPAPSGNYGINRIRVYRTQSATSGAADFYFLRELGTVATVAATALTAGTVYTILTVGTTDFRLLGAATNDVGVEFMANATNTGLGTGTATHTTITYADTSDDGRALGEVMPTTTWTIPPKDLSWLTGLWNGMMAGISGRSVRFCEAFTFYAWPIAYEILPTNAQPVALATYGQTLVMLTNGNPSIITGGTPDAMDESPVEFYQACIAPLSSVGVGHGVVWASPDGLCYVGQGGARVLTEGIMTRDDWQAINPTSIKGCFYERRYIGFYTVSGVHKAFLFDFNNPNGLYFMDFGADALYLDDLQDALYILDSTAGSVQKWDAGSAKTVTFKSKLFQMPKPTQAFACAQVVADYAVDVSGAFIVGRSYTITSLGSTDFVSAGAVSNTVGLLFTAGTVGGGGGGTATRSCLFALYVDGVIKFTKTVSSCDPFRLPSGFYGQTFQIQVASNGPIQGVAMAHSMTEIAQV